MSSNIVKLKVPKRMGRKPKSSLGQVHENVVELPLLNQNITPQELLAMLSRNMDITEVLVIFPQDDPNDENIQYTKINSANMTLERINFLADKAKMSAMGFEV